MEVVQERTGRTIRLSQSQQFLAQERITVEEAYAGDIVGIFDPGIFNIGDTLCSKDKIFKFEGIPMFPSEHFADITARDASKRKQFLKGVLQLSEEGAIQVFKKPDSGMETLTVGVAGELQFEVLAYRMRNEYNVDINIQRLPYAMTRWADVQEFTKDMLGFNEALILEDQYRRPVLLVKNDWTLNRIRERNKDIVFYDIAPSA
jgi:peptide chain release factor 3